MHACHAHRRRGAGFTLIETLVAMAIAAILSSIAYPSYVGAMNKARRFDAVAAMMNLRMAQERYRANDKQYASQLAQVSIGTLSPARHYKLSIISSDATGYAALAVATGAQQGDARCRYLQLTVQGHQVTRASGHDATMSNNAAENRQCWRL